MVALLGLAIFFCYSLVAFAFLRESFFQESAGRHCRTVYQCFITMIHHGFVDSPYTVIMLFILWKLLIQHIIINFTIKKLKWNWLYCFDAVFHLLSTNMISLHSALLLIVLFHLWYFQTFEGIMNDNFQDVITVTIFDVTFFILITTIGLNIIFGIIVDTFSQLRDAKVLFHSFFPVSSQYVTAYLGHDEYLFYHFLLYDLQNIGLLLEMALKL